ncbi:MAG: hypothetical protein L6R43_06455 [Planctomycetes bacterium]|nr:hypothetical protein [Planctomycetota bacterium]
MTLRRRFTGEVAGSLSVRGGDGELRLGDGLSEGDYRIEVEGEGRGYFESELTIRSPGEIVRVEAELGDPAWIRVPRDSPGDGTGFLCFLDGNDDILAIRLVEPAAPRVMVKPGHHRFRFLDPATLTPPMEGDAVRGETLTVDLPAVRPTVVEFEGGVAGSWTVMDEEGQRRTLYLFRGLNLVHIGDEVAPREGDRLLTDPAPGLRLVSLSAPERQHPLLPGRANRYPGER